MFKPQILLKLDETHSCLGCLLLLFWDQFMAFRMSTYTSTLPIVPVGLCWVTVQPAQISSDSSEIPESSNTLSWPPRNPPNAHTWDLTSAAVSWHLLAEASSKRASFITTVHEQKWTCVSARWMSCPLPLTFLVMNVQQQSAQGAFRVRGPLKDHLECPPLPPQRAAGLLIMKLWKILPSVPLLQRDVLLGQCGSSIRRKNFSLRGDLVHINETLIIYTCFVFELEKKIKLCPTRADSRKQMCSVQERLLRLKHHDVKNIDFYASQEAFFCSIFYLQDMA